jgi:hypothetical protein
MAGFGIRDVEPVGSSNRRVSYRILNQYICVASFAMFHDSSTA